MEQRKFIPIANAFLIVTNRCNLACRYCFVHQESIDMPLQVAYDTIDFLVKNNPNDKTYHQIFFFGGEPLLRYHDLIVPVIEYVHHKYPHRNFSFSMTTNCVLLDEEKIKFFNENKVFILTSIDGNKSTQDFNRPFHGGAGSHDIVEKNIKELLKTRKNLQFRSTIVPETCHNLFNNYLYAHSLGYSSMFWITDAYTHSWEKQEEQDAYYEQMVKITNHYIDYFKQNNKPFISLKHLERHFIQVEEDYKNILAGKTPPNFETHIKCGYGNNSNVAVSAEGDMYACQELVTNEGKNNLFWIGNIYTGVDNEKRQMLYNKLFAFPKTGDVKCEDCCAKSICSGGCVSTNYCLTGEFRHCIHQHCFHTRICYQMSMYIVMSLRDNPAFREMFLTKKPCNPGCGSCQNGLNPVNLEQVKSVQPQEKEETQTQILTNEETKLHHSFKPKNITITLKS